MTRMTAVAARFVTHGTFCHQRGGNKPWRHCTSFFYLAINTCSSVCVCVCVCVCEREREWVLVCMCACWGWGGGGVPASTLRVYLHARAWVCFEDLSK